MHAKIYARVSTTEQAEKGYSLDTQLDACRKKAAELGCHDPEEYVDDGYSGEFLNRPALDQLRASIHNTHFDGVVIVFDPDRLARNLAHQLIITDEIEKAQAELIFVSVTFEQSPEGKLFYSIRGAVSAYEKEKIKERSMRGKRGKAQKGKLVSSDKPLGYDLDKPNSTYIINDAEAVIIRKIYELCTKTRIGTRAIAQELNLLGYRTKNNKKFYMAAVYRIITNPMYKGTKQAFRYYDKLVGQTKGTSGKAQKKTKRTVRNESEWIEIPVPAIIDSQTWDEAQRVLQDNKKLSSRNSKRRYLLSGIIRCGYCGKAMIGVSYPSHGYFYQYYICNARWENKDACSNRYVRIEQMDNDVWAALRTAAETRNDIPAIQSTTEDDGLRQRMVKALEDLKKRQAMLVKLIRDNSVEDIELVDKEIRSINKEIKLAQTTLNNLIANRPKPGPNHTEVLRAETFDQKRAVLRGWGIKIYVKRDENGRVEWGFKH